MFSFAEFFLLYITIRRKLRTRSISFKQERPTNYSYPRMNAGSEHEGSLAQEQGRREWAFFCTRKETFSEGHIPISRFSFILLVHLFPSLFTSCVSLFPLHLIFTKVYHAKNRFFFFTKMITTYFDWNHFFIYFFCNITEIIFIYTFHFHSWF